MTTAPARACWPRVNSPQGAAIIPPAISRAVHCVATACHLSGSNLREKLMPSIRRWSVVVGAVLVGLIVGWTSASLRADADKPAALVYELRTYTTEEGRLLALHARFKDHTMKLFEKHGMKNVLYFTAIDADGKSADNKLIYLLAHKSQAAAKASFDAFRQDPEWIAARDASEKDGKIVAKLESQFLNLTEYSPGQ